MKFVISVEFDEEFDYTRYQDIQVQKERAMSAMREFVAETRSILKHWTYDSVRQKLGRPDLTDEQCSAIINSVELVRQVMFEKLAEENVDLNLLEW